MQIEGKVKPDEVTLLSVVSAISVIGALDLGKWVDAYVSKNGLALTVALGTALIDMFSRCGSINVVGDEIHEFFSGDDSHLESLEVRKFLQQIITDIRVEGYEPYTSNVFHDIEDEEKEQSIGFHSEKLAVAFALVSFTDSRRTIRIMKNLRTCRDCHSFMKRVSRKFDREIIVRDRNRFHHFRDGACSCQDYW
ncbi:Pentatricopeptide repeat-containing protein At4g21065 [Linum grandiflorum]